MSELLRFESTFVPARAFAAASERRIRASAHYATRDARASDGDGDGGVYLYI